MFVTDFADAEANVTTLANIDEINKLIARGALFVVNHSAGKDSQAMFIRLKEIVPAAQLVIVHADLGRVEWSGVQAHIRATVGDTEILVCRARRDLLQMASERGMFPSPQQRQCTSDLKRGPIEKTIRHFVKAHPEYNGLVVNCMGLRGQESSSRAKKTTFKLNKGNSVAGREWYDWLPIHAMQLDEVWATIKGAGQEPHWAYSKGMTRLSCVFCIMASVFDLIIAADLNPGMFVEYALIELRNKHTISMDRRYLTTVTGFTIVERAAKAGRVLTEEELTLIAEAA